MRKTWLAAVGFALNCQYSKAERKKLPVPGRTASQRNEDGTDTRILDKAFKSQLSLPGNKALDGPGPSS